MTLMKTLYILTRTSGRPKFFDKCIKSVQRQDYPNIKHIVLIDDNNDNNYVYQYQSVDKVISISSKDFSHYEGYLNAALKSLPKDSLFCVMDDDDHYTNHDSLSLAVDFLADKKVIFFQVNLGGRVVPSNDVFLSKHKVIRKGEITMIGFIMSVDFAYQRDGNLIEFPSHTGGDHSFLEKCLTENRGHLPIEDLWNNSNIQWLHKTIASTDDVTPVGNGQCMDSLF